MAEYELANGAALTDEGIERICAEFEGETWSGRLERIHQGAGDGRGRDACARSVEVTALDGRRQGPRGVPRPPRGRSEKGRSR